MVVVVFIVLMAMLQFIASYFEKIKTTINQSHHVLSKPPLTQVTILSQNHHQSKPPQTHTTVPGAIDVVVVRHTDGTLTSSPWHVRFGKMGILWANENVVSGGGGGGWMDGWMDGCMDGWMDGRMDGWMEEWINEWMEE